MASNPRHKTKASPKSRATYKTRGGGADAAAKGTFNPPATCEGQEPGPQTDPTDEDRTGRFIGRFGGAGEPPLPRR